MDESKPVVLVVDDELFNLQILIEYLEDAGYETVSAENGMEAWALLEAPNHFEAVLLDRMMPGMDGLEVLARIKAHPSLSSLPVILQTAKAGKEDILEGLEAGAYYYLTKPFDEDRLLAIVKTAVGDYQRFCAIRKEAEKTNKTLLLMNKVEFGFSTLEEGRDLIALLSNTSPDAARIAIGLAELLINAVEHGNLGITYEEKSQLNEKGIWEEEVGRRLALPENAGKKATVTFERTDSELHFVVKDQGSGFDWQDYLEISPERVFDNHGRGIAMAKTISFDSIDYKGNGNEVHAITRLK